jgi:hypothetical protein
MNGITKFPNFSKLRNFLKGGILTGKHEIMKTGRRQGIFWMGLI